MLITLRSTTLEWHQKIKYSNPLYDQELQVGGNLRNDMDRLLNDEFNLVEGQVLLQGFYFDMLLHLF